MEIYVNISFISGFKHDFVRCVVLTRIAVSNTANYVTHRIFNTDLLYSCAHFVVKFDEKFSLNDLFLIRFNDDT